LYERKVKKKVVGLNSNIKEKIGKKMWKLKISKKQIERNLWSLPQEAILEKKKMAMKEEPLIYVVNIFQTQMQRKLLKYIQVLCDSCKSDLSLWHECSLEE
jgi:Zn finger protein HypA/HybF involved in hydrogenase expression